MSWHKSTYAGWGRALQATGEIALPAQRDQIAQLDGPAPAMGMRRSYGDAALNSDGRIIDMRGLDRFLSFDPDTGILELEAGARIGDVAASFAPRGWLPAVMPGTGFATIGGCIGQDVHGKNHHHMGSFCQHVTEITLLQNGTEITAKPNSALFRATAGGLGQTGVITRAKIHLIPAKGDLMLVTERRARNWDEHIALLDASEANYTVGWIDATATGSALGRGIVEEGENAAGLSRKRPRPARVPLDAPHFALAKPVVRAFNWAYFHRVPRSGRTVLRSLQDFFFPLDKIHDWNRLYGKRGFYQFQCVVPLDQAPALRAMLQDIALSGLASPLAVLKRMGAGRAGYLSFPMEGYTLAIDFPNRPEARSLIQRLQTMTADAGGRLYFAKDGLATGPVIAAMYPDLPKWQRACAKADPECALATDLVRRLNLRTA